MQEFHATGSLDFADRQTDVLYRDLRANGLFAWVNVEVDFAFKINCFKVGKFCIKNRALSCIVFCS